MICQKQCWLYFKHTLNQQIKAWPIGCLSIRVQKFCKHYHCQLHYQPISFTRLSRSKYQCSQWNYIMMLWVSKLKFHFRLVSAAPCIREQFWSLSKYVLSQLNAILKARNQNVRIIHKITSYTIFLTFQFILDAWKLIKPIVVWHK